MWESPRLAGGSLSPHDHCETASRHLSTPDAWTSYNSRPVPNAGAHTRTPNTRAEMLLAAPWVITPRQTPFPCPPAMVPGSYPAVVNAPHSDEREPTLVKRGHAGGPPGYTVERKKRDWKDPRPVKNRQEQSVGEGSGQRPIWVGGDLTGRPVRGPWYPDDVVSRPACWRRGNGHFPIIPQAVHLRAFHVFVYSVLQ